MKGQDMKYAMQFLGAAALAAGLAAPAFADTMADPATMKCADLMAMDMDGMMAAGTAIKAMPTEDTAMAAMSAEDLTKAAETACKAHPDAMVMDAMKM
jgi:hypothetical protein